MYKKIIVPIAIDQLEHGEKVIDIAQALVDPEGEIILLNVVEDLYAYAQGYMIVDFRWKWSRKAASMRKRRSTASSPSMA